MRIISLSLVVLLFLSSSAAFAGDAVEKLGRGTANVITSPFEIPATMGAVEDEKGPFAGFTWGMFQGTVNFVRRAAVGAFEMATFPLPIPKNYDPVLDEPEYFMQPGEKGRL